MHDIIESSSSQDCPHNWVDDERYILLLLKEDYDLDWTAVGPLWNVFFETRLDGQGVAQAALAAQYRQLRRKLSRAGQRAGYVLAVPPELSEQDVKNKISKLASSLGITLAKTDNDTRSSFALTTRSKRKSDSAPQTPTSFQHLPFITGYPTPLSPQMFTGVDAEASPSTPRKKPRVETPNRGHYESLSPTLKGPSVAFRGWSLRSQGFNGGRTGFQAGLFNDIEPACIPACPNPKSEHFNVEATFHVGWTKGRPSPFISITTSPIRAMMRARAPKQDRWIAVIDLAKLQASCSIFLASDLNLRPYRTDGTAIPYQPGGEWLIWGRIPPDCVLSVSDIDDLISPPPSIPCDKDPLCLEFISTAWRRMATRAHMNKEGRLVLSYFAGSAVGQLCYLLFPDASDEHLGALVERIVVDWHFRTRKNENWKENAIFCEGVEKGYSYENLFAEIDHGEVIDLTGEDEIASVFGQLDIVVIDAEHEDQDDTLGVKEEPMEDQAQGPSTKRGADGEYGGKIRITDFYRRQREPDLSAQQPICADLRVAEHSKRYEVVQVSQPEEAKKPHPLWTGM